jgi:membrane protein implicated in regulation of membrane protease activity
LLFSVLSVLFLLFFRNRILLWLEQSTAPFSESIDTLVGEYAFLQQDLPLGAFGKAELRGSIWSVQNGDTQTLAKGQRCRVHRVDGLTLIVHAQ